LRIDAFYEPILPTSRFLGPKARVWEEVAEALVRESPQVPTKEEEEAVEATKFAPRSMMVVVLLEVEGPYWATVDIWRLIGIPSCRPAKWRSNWGTCCRKLIALRRSRRN